MGYEDDTVPGVLKSALTTAKSNNDSLLLVTCHIWSLESILPVFNIVAVADSRL